MKRRDLFKGFLALAVVPFVPRVLDGREQRVKQGVINAHLDQLALSTNTPVWPRRTMSREELEALYPYPSTISPAIERAAEQLAIRAGHTIDQICKEHGIESL